MKKTKKSKLLHHIDIHTAILFCLYLILLVWIIIFKTEFGLPYIRPNRELNIIPFVNYVSVGLPFFDAFANVIVFIPLGIYLKLLDVKGKIIIPIGAALSFCFELVQFVFSIGVADTTDLITNTAGAALGVAIYVVLLKLSKKKSKLDKTLKIIATVITAIAFAICLTLAVAYLFV